MCFLWPCEIVFSAVFKIIQSRGEPIPAVSGSGGGSSLTAHRNKLNLASNIYTTLTLYRVYSYFKCSLVGDAICGCFKLIGVSLLEEKSLDANDHKFLLLLTVPSHLLYHLQHTVPTKVTPSFFWRRHTAVILPWLCFAMNADWKVPDGGWCTAATVPTEYQKCASGPQQHGGTITT